MITYEQADNGNIKVRVDGTLTGRIKPAREGGWFYLPLGQVYGGEVYPTIERVKLSLESDYDDE